MSEDGLHKVTLCEACDHVLDRKPPPYAWLCLAHPKLPAFDGFIVSATHEKTEPYLKCGTVNGGLCKLWTPKRDGQMQLATGGGK